MVLLVVDTQKLITNDKLYEFDLFKNRVKELVKQARINGVEVIFIRHDDGIESELTKGKGGFEIYDEFKPMNNELIFDKKVNSAFNGTGLLTHLNQIDEKTIMVMGLQTDYCIDATIKCGFEHGFKMIVPENTNSTFDNDYMSGETSYKYYNEFIWKNRYAECISFEDALKLIKK